MFLILVLALWGIATAQHEEALPVIDIEAMLIDPGGNHTQVYDAVRQACERTGFFYVKTGTSVDLLENLQRASHAFFRLPMEEKESIAMHKSKRAWRGFFQVATELTSGIPDMKEGIYFGKHEANYTGDMPLRGKNLWPSEEFGELVLDYMKLMKRVGRSLMHALTKALTGSSLEEHFSDPTELFRIFSYPPPLPHDREEDKGERFGVGEHTDYGFLTILYQDASGGLQARSENGTWLDVPFIDGTHVVNLGDALEHYTHGQFRATPHRVLFYGGGRSSTTPRLSFPYFFDPHWTAPMTPMEEVDPKEVARWDHADPKQFEGTYGEYLQSKISRVFPALFEDAIQARNGEEEL